MFINVILQCNTGLENTNYTRTLTIKSGCINVEIEPLRIEYLKMRLYGGTS
jgi:hypothetical protein